MSNLFLKNRRAALAVMACGLSLVGTHAAAAGTGYPGMDDSFPFFAPAAGQVGSTAINKSDPGIVAWATGYTGLNYGPNVAGKWQTPEKALGPAVGDSFDIVSLGPGGSITLTFTRAIRNGSGPDFAVFENSFSNTFLELAWVEVSTDGVHFVRCPNFSFTLTASGSIDPTYIHGLAGKYRQGFGTPFDLEQLQIAHDAILAGTDHFSSSYKTGFLANFPYLDLDAVHYVRVIDIVGDGSALDSEGEVIYDPYPTTGSAGFDLEAEAVLNQIAPGGLSQTITFAPIGHQKISNGSTTLQAIATSNLPVNFEVLSGPATVSAGMLTFTGLGSVVVRAIQDGDASYAPADPVTQSFYIADALQHIYLEPIANQLTGATDVPLYARSSSGLPVSLFVDAGPVEALVNQSTHLFSSGPSAGSVRLRASQPGGELLGVTYAPADDVSASFEIVATGDANAPQTFSEWQAERGLAGSSLDDSDADGAADYLEYVANTDPQDPSDRPNFNFEAAAGGYMFELSLNGRAPVRVRLLATDDLSDPSAWAEVVPEVLSSESSEPGQTPMRVLQLTLPPAGPQQFWRFSFDAN